MKINIGVSHIDPVLRQHPRFPMVAGNTHAPQAIKGAVCIAVGIGDGAEFHEASISVNVLKVMGGHGAHKHSAMRHVFHQAVAGEQPKRLAQSVPRHTVLLGKRYFAQLNARHENTNINAGCNGGRELLHR